MAQEKQTRQPNKQGKPSGKKTASKMPLPGSKRIEKALTLPTTTDRPNPFLDRLDATLAKPPPGQPAKPPANQPVKPPEK